jgi:nitroreductase
MNVWEAIQTKRAIRSYKRDRLPMRAVERILDAGRRAQSAMNRQPWDFIAVQDRETLTRLTQTSQWVGHVGKAALCIALLTPVTDADRHPWHMFDLGQAATYMQLAAHDIGVASCLGQIQDVALAREILGFPADRTLPVVLSFGYPAAHAQARVPGKQNRRPFDDVVHWDQW